MEKKFIYVSTEEKWEENKHEILNPEGRWFKSIVFRAGTKEIYNRGEAYGVSGSEAQKIEDALHYNTSLGDLTTPQAIGGISSGTKASELNGKTMDEMLTMILFPELNPTIVAPSGSTTFTSGFTKDACYEVGSALPTSANMGYSLNRGSIKVAGVADKYRAGGATGATYAVSGKATSFGGKFIEGTYTYTATISYGEGDEALTSYSKKATKDINGNTITNPLPSGSLVASAISIKGVYAIYASTSIPNTLTKQTLTASKTNVQLTLKGGVGQVFAVKGTVSSIMEYNAVSGKYDINATNAYTKSSITKQDAGGSDVTYSQYKRNDDSGKDVKIQITFA